MATQQGTLEGPEVDLLEAAGVDLSKVRRIPIADIKPGRHQPRRVFDPAETKSLAENIRANGQSNIAIVNKLPDGSREYVSGERRGRALMLLGRVNILAAEVEITDDKLLSKLACASNDERVNISDLDTLDYCLRQRDEFGMSDEEIAASHGKSLGWVSNTFALDRLHGTLRAKLGSSARGGITRSTAMQLIRVTAADQPTVLKKAREKGSCGEKRVRRIVDEMLADGQVNPHPDAQDRSTPTDHFLTFILGGCGSAVEGLKRLASGPRRTKLGRLEADDATRVRARLDDIRAAVDTLAGALPSA